VTQALTQFKGSKSILPFILTLLDAVRFTFETVLLDKVHSKFPAQLSTVGYMVSSGGLIKLSNHNFRFSSPV
jgi:hypothetical protein